MSSATPILLVEDDPNDVFFLKYAFEEANITVPLQVLTDGQEAIDYLRGKSPYSDRNQYPLPGLVLLDLKLPVKMGLDVLGWIRQRPELAGLIVVVLTSSSNKNDIRLAYELGARSYLVKPLTLEKRVELARLIKSYWLDLNRVAEAEPNAPVSL